MLPFTLTHTNTSIRVTFATCSTDSAGSTLSENYGNDDDLLVDGTDKAENGDYCVATNGDEIRDDDEENDDGEIYDSEDNAVYKGLQVLYRGLPKEMFINRILIKFLVRLSLGKIVQPYSKNLRKLTTSPMANSVC